MDIKQVSDTEDTQTGQERQTNRTGQAALCLLHHCSLSAPPQILIFGIFLVPVLTCKMHRCYEDHELSEAVERKLRSHYPQPQDPAPAAARDSPAACPVALYQQQAAEQLSGRSLSPWRYV